MGGRSSNLRSVGGIGSGIALLVIPRRLRWSRRSRRVLALSATGLIGMPVLRRLFGWGAGAERVSAALIGLLLGGVQYLLSEEDSSVRGAIATIGGLLALSALFARDDSTDEDADA